MNSGDVIQAPSAPTDAPPPSDPKRARPNAMKAAREWIQVIVIALLIALPIRFLVAEPFVVNGASMDPTFSTGQFLIVDRLTYDFAAPHRGDVIVFEYPGDHSIYYIKRIIGLPGEEVKSTKGVITIIPANASSTPEILAEPYIAADHRSYDDFDVKLGPTEYWTMGDNRAQSSDSRAWGPLDRSLIVGRPLVRLLPLDQVSAFPGAYKE